MKDLIIVGAGASGQEVYAWAHSHFESMGVCFKGFIDDIQPNAISKIIDYSPAKNDVFICSIGSSETRIKCSELIRQKGGRFINFIHPSAIVLSKIVGTGVIIAPFVYIANDVQIEDDVFLNASATVGHNAVIGQGSVICAHVDITGYVVIGHRVLIGSHACVVPGKQVGDAAIVGAGSAVMRNVPAGATVIGVPAKRFI